MMSSLGIPVIGFRTAEYVVRKLESRLLEATDPAEVGRLREEIHSINLIWVDSAEKADRRITEQRNQKETE